MEATKKPAAGYYRVSTEDQAKGISPQMQPDKIRTYATLYDYEIPEEAWFHDDGISGRSAGKRPGLQEAIKWCIANKATLIVYDIDRFMRNTREGLDIEFRLREGGARLASVNQRFDTSAPEGFLMFTFFLGIAQYESDKTSRRTRDCLQRAKREGRIHAGKPDYGYQRDMSRPEVHRVRKTTYYPHLVPHPQEQALIAHAQELYKRGMTVEEIRQKINTEGYKNRHGKLWSWMRVRDSLLTPAALPRP